jgi:hypothetical protein
MRTLNLFVYAETCVAYLVYPVFSAVKILSHQFLVNWLKTSKTIKFSLAISSNETSPIIRDGKDADSGKT